MQMVHALNAQTAQYATDVEKDAESAQRARTNWWMVHDAPTDRQIVFVYLFFRAKYSTKRYIHIGRMISNTWKSMQKRQSMQICKYGDFEAIRDGNF